MPRNLSVLGSLAVVASAIAAGSAPATVGCSSSSAHAGSSSGAGASSPSVTASDSGAVSFAQDVMPQFALGCTLSMACHGQPDNMQEANFYLGFNPTDDSGTNTPEVISKVYKELMGMSAEDPQMPIVDPGHPENSYLIQKLNGTLSSLASACMSAPNPCSSYSSDCTPMAPCGGQMPDTGTPWSMPAAQGGNPAGLALVTNWVTQGAPNN